MTLILYNFPKFKATGQFASSKQMPAKVMAKEMPAKQFTVSSSSLTSDDLVKDIINRRRRAVGFKIIIN